MQVKRLKLGLRRLIVLRDFRARFAQAHGEYPCSRCGKQTLLLELGIQSFREEIRCQCGNQEPEAEANEDISHPFGQQVVGSTGPVRDHESRTHEYQNYTDLD